MANNPKFSVEPTIVGIEDAMRRMQNVVARRPIKVSLATDTKGLDGLNKGLGKLSGSADEFTKSLEAANARVLAFGASVAVISAIQRGFVNLVKSTVEVEAAFKKISVVGDQFAATAGQLEKFGRGIFDVARQTGQSFDETSKAALEFARQGLGAAETLVRVKDALTLTRLSGLDATSSVEGLTAAVNSFKREGLSTTDVLNKLIAVDNKYAVSSGDLIEAIKRSGSFAQEAGVSFDELTATVTVLQEATARGGSVIGNSLKTIFERVQRPESIRQLKDLGVEVEDANKKLLPAIKIVDNFANSLDGMSEAKKREARSQLAGTLQINQFSALSNALEEVRGASRRYDDVLATSANATIEAATANNKLNESLDAQIKALLATGTQLGSLFGNIAIAPALKGVVDPLSSFGTTLINGLSADGPSITKAFASVIGDAILAAGVAGTLSIGSILKKFAIFAKDSFSNILGINSATKNQESIQLTILNTLRARSDIEAAILGAGTSQVAQAQILAKLYKDIADQDARRVATSKVLSQALASNFVVGSTGLPTPKGKRSASGYVPDLIQAEYADIKKGTGGAKKNSGVVLINDFPFGGGKKGPMVANTSEGILPMGNSAAVLNQDMLDRMGYGKRAAEGSSPSFSLANSTVAGKSGKFLSVNKLEKVVEETARTLGQQNVAGIKFTNAINKAIKDAGFDLTGKSLREIGTTALKFSKDLKAYDITVKDAYQLAIQENAQKQKLQAAESARISAIKTNAANLNDPLSRAAELNKIGYSNTNFSKSVTSVGGGNPLALSRSIVRLPDDGETLPNPLGSYQPIRGRAKASDPLTRATQIGLERRLAAIENRPRGLSSVIGDFAVRNRTSGGSNASFGVAQRLATEQAQAAKIAKGGEYEIRNRLEKLRIEDLKKEIKARLSGGAGPGDKLKLTDRFGEKNSRQTVDDVSRSLADLTPEIVRAKKTFSEVAIDFGTQAGTIFLGASVVKNTFEALGIQAGKLTDTVRDAIIGVIAFKKINELGGKKGGTGSLLDAILGPDFKKGRKLGRRSGPLSGSEMDFLGQSRGASRGFRAQGLIQGVAAFGTRLLGIVPVLGQLAAGLFVANSVLSYFGVDAWASIKQFVTGLSAEGEKAKESLKTFSESLFENGQFVGKSREDIFRELSSTNQQNRANVQAKLAGIKTDGREPKEVQAELFNKQISSILDRQKTGRRKETFDYSVGSVGNVAQISTGFKDEFVSDLPNDVRAVLADVFGRIGSLSVEELKLFAKDKKIETSAKDGVEQLREKIVSAAFAAVIGPDSFNLATGGKEATTNRLVSFAKPTLASRQEQAARNPQLFTDVNTVRAQVSAALELKKLQLDFSTESERVLETKIKTAQISDIERTNLQTVLDGLKLERALRGDIFDIASKGIDKLTNAEGFGDLEKTNLKASIEGITRLGLGVQETKDEVVKILDVLGGDIVTENIKKEILGQLDGLKGSNEERRKQLIIQSDQLKNETRITDQIRKQQSLIELAFSSRLSSLDTSKSGIEGRIGVLSAQASNPNLTTREQESSRRAEIALQIQSLAIEKERAAVSKNQKEIELLKELNVDESVRAERLRLVSEEYDRATQSINDQINALKIQEGQIGASASAMTLLANAAYQFSQNLGEIESSNILSTLRATDFSSLGSSLSSQQAFSDLGSSGKTGLDAEQFLAERTALRQKEFEIASATSKVQKLQLTQEKQLLEDIFAAKKSGLAPDEAIARLIELQNKRLKEQRSLRSGVNSATAEIKDEIDQFGSEFGRTATFGFRDSLSEALKAAANGTGDLKNALLDVALSFANKLRDAALDNLANIATNALFGSGGGSGGGGNIVSSLVSGLFGGAQKRAAGGPISGGSGNKDDVPILGMGGEFMINKQSVKKYGPQLFEALNQGRLQKMARGGLVDPSISGKAIVGAANLKKFAGQSFTSGATDKILNLGGGAASVELEPESLRLTNFARQSGNPLQSATKEAKDQALSLVFQDQELRKQYKDQIDALKKAEKEKQKQLLVSLAVAAVGAGVGGAFGGSGTGGTGSLYGQKNLPTYDASNSYVGMTSALSNRSIVSSTSSASNVSAGVTRALSSSGAVGLSELYRPNQVGTYNGIIPSLRASGGPVGGSGYGDNVPAMLSGGEFVMNRKAAKNLGLANLSAANSGQSMGLSEEKSEELNEKLIAKLDELVEKMSGGNNVTVNVSMDKEGKTSASETGQQNEDQKNMNRRIKDAVVQILQEEKRLGGVLRK
jgi:TP901 family phage tail tape measure protein